MFYFHMLGIMSAALLNASTWSFRILET